MKAQPPGAKNGHEKAALLKSAGLAAALGAAAWLIAPLLLPVRVPADFPQLPDLAPLNPALGERLRAADDDARRRPGSAEAVGKLAMVYHANLLFDQAARAYRIAARLAPGDYRWAYGQAFLAEENGNEREQLKFLEQTLQLKPDYLPALVKLADSNLKMDRLDEAEQYYERASRTPEGGGSLQASFGWGRVAARRRDWNRVVERIAPLTRAYPQAAPLYALLEEAYAALGQAEPAAKARESAALAGTKSIPPLEDPFNEQLIALCDSSTRLLKHAGLLSRTGRAARAIEIGRRAAEADPADPDVRHFLARTLITAYPDKPEAIEEALVQLAECLRLRPQDPVPLGGFANDFFKTPKPPAAVSRLRALLRSRNDVPGAHFFLGMAAEALGETAEAVAHYRAALKENPKHSAAYNKLGLIAERAGNSGEAVAHLRKAVQLNPAGSSARLNLAIVLIKRGEHGQGLKELEELLKHDPYDASAHFLTGFALLSLRRNGEAIARFRQGLRYKPDDAEAHFGLGTALAAERRREEAVKQLREALRLRPDLGQARQLLSQLEP